MAGDVDEVLDRDRHVRERAVAAMFVEVFDVRAAVGRETPERQGPLDGLRVGARPRDGEHQRAKSKGARLAPRMAAVTRSSFLDRMIRAARLDAAVYEEIEHDTTATVQSGIVVVLGAISAGLANGVRLGFLSLLAVSLLALASWSFYAWLAYFFGGTVLKGPLTQTNWGEIARTLGFANAPRLLLLLAAIPGLAVIALLIPFWIIATTVVALRAALVCGCTHIARRLVDKPLAALASSRHGVRARLGGSGERIGRGRTMQNLMKDLTITLEDRPGTLAKAAEAIAKAGINIEGATAVPQGGRGELHILTRDSSATRRALESAGYKVETEQPVVVADVEDKPGAGADV